MKQFYTVVLDRLTDIRSSFETEPYEAGWADEVVAYVRVHKLEAPKLCARLQISPDGICWVDEGAKAEISKEGILFMRAVNFGGWLRIAIECDGEANITTYLALKG